MIKVLPIVGVLTFIVLYVYSSNLYVGGSHSDYSSFKFDCINNYWCDLMSEKGYNGHLNPSRLYAVTAMVILCLSLGMFFVCFAVEFAKTRFWRFVIGVFGVLSMAVASFIFTSYHDLVIGVSSFFGFFVVLGIIWEVYKGNLPLFKWSGALCILLLALNNFIYYSNFFLDYLPLIQKVTFVVVLSWIVCLNLNLFSIDRS